jgi:hypothetical protein
MPEAVTLSVEEQLAAGRLVVMWEEPPDTRVAMSMVEWMEARRLAKDNAFATRAVAWRNRVRPSLRR